jgi:hypothetical protein
MPRAPRVTSKPHTDRHARTTTECRSKLVDRCGGWEIGDFFDVDSGVVVALVFFGIGVPFEVDEFQARAPGHKPLRALFVILRADFRKKLLGSSDDFCELLELPSDEDSDSGFTIEGGVLEPIADGGFGLAASARTTVEDFENRTLD